MYPDVVKSCKYGTHGSGNSVNETITNRLTNWEQLKDLNSFHLSINSHLESGKRIEDFLPDLGIDYFPKWVTGVDASSLPDGELIGIYGSCYAVNRHWNFWIEDDWMKLIRRKAKDNPNATFVVIGAAFDLDLGSKIIAKCREEGINVYDCIGKSLGFVVEVMKRLDYFYSFPSGLGILAASVKCPTLMFYPPHLKDMMKSWAHPDSIESGLFRESLFCTVEEAYNYSL